MTDVTDDAGVWQSGIVEPYGPIVMGWATVVTHILWMLGIVNASYPQFLGFISASMLAVLGHHALAMGWYDER